jgi:hypothetical protein
MVYARCRIRRLEEVNKLRTKYAYIVTHLRESLVEENFIVRMPPEDIPPPSFEDAWDLLPQPFWEDHKHATVSYRGAWELAFANLHVVATLVGNLPSTKSTWIVGLGWLPPRGT